MAFSLRNLLQKLQGGVDALRKPLPPPVVIQPTQKQLASPRVQQAYNQAQPYIQAAQKSFKAPTVQIPNTIAKTTQPVRDYFAPTDKLRLRDIPRVANEGYRNATFRALNLPEAAVSGIIRQGREATQQGRIANPIKGIVQGVRDDYNFVDEANKILPNNPKTALTLGLIGSVALPGPGEGKLLTKGKKVASTLDKVERKSLPRVKSELDKVFIKGEKPKKIPSLDMVEQTDEPFLANVGNKLKAIDPLSKEERQAVKAQSYTPAQKILTESKDVKDKGTFMYQRETLMRNIEDTFKNKDEANKIKDEFVRPIVENETKNVLFKNNLKKELGNTFKQFGIKKGKKEDFAAADYIEGTKSLEQLQQEFPQKWQGIVQSAEEGRKVYKMLLDKINESITKHGYAPIPERQNYVTHTRQIESLSNRLGNLTEILKLEKDKLPTYISGINVDTKPGRQYFAFGKQRQGGSTHEGLITALEKYIEPAGNQIFHTDDIQRGRKIEKALKDVASLDPNSERLSNFNSYFGEYVNSISGKKDLLDRPVEKKFSRDFLRLGSTLKKRVGANMVGANVSSALTNFIPLTQSIATTSKPAVAKGLYRAALSPLEGIRNIDGQVSSFLTRRFPENYIVPTTGQKVSEGANSLFKMVDGFTSKAIVSGKYFEGIQKGLSPQAAMAAADEYAARVITDRSFGQLPLFFNSKALGFLSQFQAEVNNQVSFLGKDIFKNLGLSKAQVASALTQVAVYSFLYNEISEKVTGRRPALDPLGSVLQTLQDLKEGKGASSFDPFTENTGTGQLVGNIPFAGVFTGGRIPLSSAFPDFRALAKGETTLGKEIKKPLYTLLPPFGGNQLKKTIEGLDAYQRGVSVTDSGKARFDIEQTPGNLARTAVFGQYSVPEAKKYFKDPKSVSVTNVEPQLTVTESGKISVKGAPAPSVFGALKDKVAPQKPQSKEKITETVNLLKQGVIDKDAAKKRIKQALLEDAVLKLNKGDKSALTPLLLQELKKGLKSDISTISKDPSLTIEQKKTKIKNALEVFKKTVGKQVQNVKQSQNKNILSSLGPITGLNGSSLWKPGLDIDLQIGTPVPSPIAGKVISSKYNGGFGNQVKIAGVDGREYWLSHLSKRIPAGQQVQAGQIIGLGGNTGNTIPGPGGDGSHLDLTVKQGNQLLPAAGVAQLLKSFS